MSDYRNVQTIVCHQRGLQRVETLMRDYWAELQEARVTRSRREADLIAAALRDLIDVRRTLQGRAK